LGQKRPTKINKN